MRKYSITKTLSLPEYKIIEILSETKEEIHIRVKSYKRKPFVCSGCGNLHKGPARGIIEVMVEDRGMIDKRVYLHVVKRRRVCPADGRIHAPVGNKQSDTKNNNGGSVGEKFKIQFLPEIIFYKPS